MKATDFKREHFLNGKSFSQTDFDSYIQGSERFSKTMYTRYLPCVAGGLVVSFLFSQGVGGFSGNVLAVLCIFAGLILGGAFNLKASKAVKEYASKLGITSQDVVAARRHVKNGTFAWSGEAITAIEAKQGASANVSGTTPIEPPTAAVQSSPVLPERPLRAVWAAGFIVAAWFALVILQCVFSPGGRFMGTVFSADALMMTVAALIGTTAYLVTKSELRFRLLGGGIGLVAVLLNAWSVSIMRNRIVYSPGATLGKLLSMRYVIFAKSLGSTFLFVLLALSAALLVSILYKGQDKRRGTCLAGLTAAGAYLVCNGINTFVNPQIYLGSMQAVHIVTAMLGVVADAAVVFLICMAICALCNMKTERVKLRGVGLVWAWLAIAGALVSLIGAISAGTSGNNGVITYTAQFVLGGSALAGYILLLCKKRVGLYMILIGVGVMLGAQAMGALSGVLFSANRYLPMLIGYLLGAINPLFAYLAVRAGDKTALPIQLQK